jgi:hypothetical protein
MRDQVVDVGQGDPGLANRLGDQWRHVLDCHLLQLPRLGVHLTARAGSAGKGETEPAVLGESGEADDLDTGGASGRPFQDHGGTGIT